MRREDFREYQQVEMRLASLSEIEVGEAGDPAVLARADDANAPRQCYGIASNVNIEQSTPLSRSVAPPVDNGTGRAE